MADIKKVRRFDGRRYYLIYPDKTTSWTKPLTKQRANNLAYNEREGGRLVRVVKVAGGYAIYVRNK